ncbi:MAG: hypothetical protein ABL994_26060, partial [Verrucomicrobiales bacterium]
ADSGSIAECGYQDGGLLIRIDLKPPDDHWPPRRFLPTLKTVSLLVTDYPVRPLFARPGSKVWTGVNRKGEIVILSLGEIVITHWRKRDDGMVEIKTISPDDAGEYPFGLPATQRVWHAMQIVPDKVSLESAGSLPEGVMALRNDFGLVIFAGETGPGELELEAAIPGLRDAIRPVGERPWISEFDKNTNKQVPPGQSANDGA